MKISGLFVYPVKSCRGVGVDSVEVGETSMRNDRRFMVVTPDNELLSQRECPRMALIEAQVDHDTLRLVASDGDLLELETSTQGEVGEVTLWETLCRVVDQGDAAAEWLTAFLETPARLVAMSASYRRRVNPRLPHEFDGRLTFADAAPLLVVGSESLADLNTRLETPLPMNRFRPNIVIDGCEPYAEDGWDRILVGDLVLERLAPCGRCAITTTDQATAERGKEPLATLATYRRDPDFGVIFGSYYGHTTTGRLVVGESVTVR